MEESIPKEHIFEYKCPPDIRAMARLIMMRAEFRSAETFNEKVDILRDSEFSIPIADACKIVGISTKTYYKNKTLISQGEPELDKKTSQTVTHGKRSSTRIWKYLFF